MAKVGRNEPCPCGSGKKYKRCCLERDQLERIQHASVHREDFAGTRDVVRAMMHRMRADVDEVDEAQLLSDEAQDLVDAGRLDEAEEICRKLEADHADEPVCIELRAQLHEARGEPQAAAAEYRRAVAIMDELGEGHYCDCCRARMVKAVWRLDPDGPELVLGRDPQ